MSRSSRIGPLAEELADYHHHPTVPHRPATELSEVMSRYDLMGVFHELGAIYQNEAATLAVCLPTKAVSGWLHGAIPVVCFPHYPGIVERIEELGIGFVPRTWEEVGAIGSDRAAIAAASQRCLAHRWEFSTERTAERIADFVAPLLRTSGAANRPAATPRLTRLGRAAVRDSPNRG